MSKQSALPLAGTIRRGRGYGCSFDDLVRPMIVGDKELPVGVPASADHWAARGLALLVVTLCGASVAWLVSLGG